MLRIIIILVFFVSYVFTEAEEATETSQYVMHAAEEGEAHHAPADTEDSAEDSKKKENEEIKEEYTEEDDEEEDEDDLYVGDSEDEKMEEEKENNYEQKMIQKPLSAIVRCSRRFTPGICSQPVESVWTYKFDQQNCTERLGCHLSERTNRFHNYNRCNRMCMALSNVYSKVLDIEKMHKSTPEFGLPRRFGGIDLNDNKDMTDLPPLSETSSGNDNRPLARQYYDYVERRRSLSYDDYSSPAGDDDLVQPDLDEFRVQPEVWDDFYHNFN